MAADDFDGFLQKLRSGDDSAATELVERYASIIRREVRIRLTNPAVYRVLDEDDICQSVLASFYVRVSLGQFDLQDPAQLRQLLVGMARNKLACAGRRQQTQKRGGGQHPADLQQLAVAGDVPSPSRFVAGRELLEQVRHRLSDEERQVADLRGQGHDWAAIAAQLGGTADGRRMQLNRALNRVSEALGLDDSDE